jgi:Na+-transporting NADH:ubiquinone oxidoreductase subunit NqrC
MFSLIISVISIALVSAIAVATTYYMGTVAATQQAKADASQFIMAGEQIASAFILSTFNGGNPNIWINTLVPEYLTELPKYKGGNLYFHDTHKNYMIAYVSKEVCLEINKHSGITIDSPDVTHYTASCLVGDEFTWPLAFYKVINEKI